MHFDSIVIGGGFYGARLALALRAEGDSVVLVEKGPQLLGRASILNQARVHNGYHYPRSILTSMRSRTNYDRFLAEYPEAVHDRFDHYYAIARGGSKITAAQFAQFCRRIGAPITPAPDHVRRLFDSSRIEDVFLVSECAFDAVQLRNRLSRDLETAGVEVRLDAEVVRVTRKGSDLQVEIRDGGVERALDSRRAFNCTYSSLNVLLAASGSAVIPLKRELAEMALVEAPAELDGIGVTVMDGPFFSMMPYPSRTGLSTLSHVRYTPHSAWQDEAGALPRVADALRNGNQSRFPHMIRDAARYLPAIASARYVDSLWEIKAVMPRSEQDDSRPILFRESAELPGFFSVLGAKIDSVYDVESVIHGDLLAAGSAKADSSPGQP